MSISRNSDSHEIHLSETILSYALYYKLYNWESDNITGDNKHMSISQNLEIFYHILI